MPKKFKTWRNTLMYRFTIWYVLSLLLVMVIIGLIIIGTVSYFLYNNTRQEMRAVQDKLLLASKEGDVDWQEAIDDLLYPNYGNDYVKISNAQGKDLAYSRGWKQTFEGDQTEIVQENWLKQLLWNKDKGLFLTSSTTWKQKDGQLGTINVVAQLNTIAHFLAILMKILLFATILGVLMGSLMIYFLTKRNIRPLVAITNSVSSIKDSSDLETRVPVPIGPFELTELSTVFNTLLGKLEGQFERERSFVANASHELRTPITAFRGHVNLLKRWGKQDPKVLEQSLQAMDSEGEHMQRLVHQLLTLAESTNPIEEVKCRVSFGAVIRDARQQLEGILNDKKVIVEVDPGVQVFGEPDQLRQLAIILLENAAKYSNVNGVIEVKLIADNERAIFSVRDTGMGIPGEDISRIFERFYRVDKARSRKTGGSGLGLAIAKEIIESHHGQIAVNSTVGVGSTFTVFLPFSADFFR